MPIICNFFVSCNSVSEANPIHSKVVHLSTDTITKDCEATRLCRPKILSAPIAHVLNASTNLYKFREVECTCVFSFNMSFIADPDSKEIAEFYAEIKRARLFLFQKFKMV